MLTQFHIPGWSDETPDNFPLLPVDPAGGGMLKKPGNTYQHAMERAEAYAYAINHDYRQPEKIYAFLTREMKSRLTEEEFCACWEKERTYPYYAAVYLLPGADPL